MLSDLPSPLLRSFVAVVDGGSLGAAASRVGRSDSALSLQMARLEDLLGHPLFDRTGRALTLNPLGARLLPHARAILGRIDAARVELDQSAAPPIRIGIVQDFVETVLPQTLSALRGTAADRPITVVVGGTAELLTALGEARIDTALHAGDAIGATFVRRLPVRWFGDPDLAAREVVPLVGIAAPCPFAQAAQTALDTAGRPWRSALVTPSLDGVRAAVRAGLGLTCRTQAGLGLPPCDTGLPPLPDIAYSVVDRRHGRPGPSPVAVALSGYLAALAPAG